MSWLEAIILAVIQGVTELIPVSSLGHVIIVPDLLNWAADERSKAFLPFRVTMHLGAAAALIWYFRRNWGVFLLAGLFNRGPQPGAARRLLFQIILAAAPAVLVMLTVEHAIRDLFALPLVISAFLLTNGVMLFLVGRMKPAAATGGLHRLTWRDSLVIGLCQSLVAIPGLSGPGSAMMGAYLTGQNHEDAARFSFLSATLVIVAATVKDLPDLMHMQTAVQAVGAGTGAGLNTLDLPMVLTVGGVAGVTAYASLWAVMRWFKDHEVGGFDPFAYYGMAFGAIAVVINIVAP